MMREATRADTPKGGRTAQCPLCWRMFSSDSAAETHKPYARPKTADCKDPASMGMEPRERSSMPGLRVWTPPMSPERLLALRRGESEHSGVGERER